MNESNSLDSIPMRLTKFVTARYTLPLIVLMVLLLVVSAHPAFAQAGYTPPANLNSFPAPAVPSWLDTGSNAWMMVAGTLVGLMSVPGLALYYGGLTRKKFSINTAFMCFYGFAAVLVVWVLAGYNGGFGPAALKIGNYGILGTFTSVAPGIAEGTQALVGPAQLALNIPQSTVVWFQFVFAAITPLLFVGAIIERTNFKAWLVFVPIWSLLVYSPLAYALFGGGWLNQLGAVDFSGGYVIHLDAGIAALASAIAIGPRAIKSRGIKPNNLYFVFIGAGLLWLGWNGFNGGDPYGSSIDASIAVMNTDLATAVSAIVWMIMDMKFLGKPTMVGAMSGAITGLVAITPAAGYVSGYGAIILGIAGGTIPWLANYKLMPKLKLDDSLGVFPAHGVAGLTGGILTGILADPAVTQYVYPGLTGAAFGSFSLLGWQIAAAAVVIVYSFVVTYAIWKVIGIFMPLKMSDKELLEGDIAVHGEEIEPQHEETMESEMKPAAKM
ncbi:MAG TPA: ammonium transporter [Nitrososphaerales archaeon]|nr:ammonium transporter [Nitrososphaerales archaeon]